LPGNIAKPAKDADAIDAKAYMAATESVLVPLARVALQLSVGESHFPASSVAWMEQSGIQGATAPDSTALHPGYRYAGFALNPLVDVETHSRDSR